MLRRAAQYDLLTWQQRRLEAAINDAAALERGSLADAADRYRRAAAGIPLQPPLPELERPQLQIAAPERIELIEVPEREMTLAVTNRDPRPLETWLFCDYDPQMLEVLPGLEGRLYDLSAAPPIPPQAATEPSAERPELTGRVPSFRLRAAETGSLRVGIRRRSLTGAAARIVFRAVCDAGVVRHDCTVDLPSSPALELQIEGPRDAWQVTGNDVSLYPFPNRTTSYQLYLVNPGSCGPASGFPAVAGARRRGCSRLLPAKSRPRPPANTWARSERPPPCWSRRACRSPVEAGAC